MIAFRLLRVILVSCLLLSIITINVMFLFRFLLR